MLVGVLVCRVVRSFEESPEHRAGVLKVNRVFAYCCHVRRLATLWATQSSLLLVYDGTLDVVELDVTWLALLIHLMLPRTREGNRESTTILRDETAGLT